MDADTVSGRICQYVSSPGEPQRAIAVSLGPRISYHSHVAEMWGYPGNVVKTNIRVIASDDPKCRVGSAGRIVMYASYNGVRSDSIQLFFNAGACREQSTLYHGPQVDAQVPPL